MAAIDVVLPVVRAMSAELSRGGLRLPDMADIVHLSPYHFIRMFRRGTGLSPGAFQGALRMAEAKRLLLQSDAPVTDVCFDLGYASLGSFVARFAADVGISPARYRRLAADFEPPRPDRLAEILAPPSEDPPLGVGTAVGASVRGTVRCTPASHLAPDVPVRTVSGDLTPDPRVRTPWGDAPPDRRVRTPWHAAAPDVPVRTVSGDLTPDPRVRTPSGDAPPDPRVRTPPGDAPPDGPVFIGLFPQYLPRGVPVAGTARMGVGPFALGPVPDGTYAVLAAACPAGADLRPALLHGRGLLIAGAAGVRVSAGRSQPVHLALRPPRPTDPPVLLALNLLLARATARWEKRVATGAG